MVKKVLSVLLAAAMVGTLLAGCGSSAAESAADTAEEAVELAKTAERAMVIGGGSVYKQMLPYCDTAYITKVHTTTDCDTYFPNLDEMEDWYLVETMMTGEENGIAYEMLLYRRK